METSTLLEAIQADVATVAAVGDEVAARVAAQIAAALAPSLKLRLLEAATQAANEITPQLSEGRVEVQVRGGEPVLIYVDETPAAAPTSGDEAEARITLRLPRSLKDRVEASASREGVSVNTWLVQLLGRGVDARSRRVGNRLTGYARS